MAKETVRLTLDVNGVDEPLSVRMLHGREGLSELFELELELETEVSSLDLDAIVSGPARLTYYREEKQRVLHGLVACFEQAETTAKYTVYRAVVVPAVWLLNHRSDCRVWHGMSAPEIIAKVITEAGLPAPRSSLRGTYEARDICVQYRESDWSFVCRLMEEEGIFYFFEHDDEEHRLVLGDDKSVFSDIQDGGTILFRSAPEGESITQFAFGKAITTGRVSTRTIPFEAPDNFEDQVADGARTELELYDHTTPKPQARLESFERAAATGRGKARTIRLGAGQRFTLEEHPRESFNQAYTLTRITTKLATAEDGSRQYECAFECIPNATAFRPACRTPRPRIFGPHTATVVGPEGKEIHVDAEGRVLVRLQWDRSYESSSDACWVPVAQTASGAGYGGYQVPRVGSSVIVEFLEGHVDRPMVTGRVFNQLNPYPYSLPDHATRSGQITRSSPGGDGYNELRFEDAAGNEEVYLRSEKDLNMLTQNDARHEVGNDHTLTVGRNASTAIDGAETHGVVGNREVQVQASETKSIGGSQSLLVSQDQANVVEGTRNERVDGDSSDTTGGARSTTVVGTDTSLFSSDQTNTFESNRTTTLAGDDVSTIGGSFISTVAGNVQQSVDGFMYQTLGGLQVSVDGNAALQTTGELLIESSEVQKIGAPTIYLSGETLTIRAYTKIVLEVGSFDDDSEDRSKIEITSSGVYVTNGSSKKNLTGDTVYINC